MAQRLFVICFNDTQIVLADETNIDATPNNDDGDQSEDDEDELEIFLCNPNICLPITIIKIEPTRETSGFQNIDILGFYNF